MLQLLKQINFSFCPLILFAIGVLCLAQSTETKSSQMDSETFLNSYLRPDIDVPNTWLFPSQRQGSQMSLYFFHNSSDTHSTIPLSLKSHNTLITYSVALNIKEKDEFDDTVPSDMSDNSSYGPIALPDSIVSTAPNVNNGFLSVLNNNGLENSFKNSSMHTSNDTERRVKKYFKPRLALREPLQKHPDQDEQDEVSINRGEGEEIEHEDYRSKSYLEESDIESLWRWDRYHSHEEMQAMLQDIREKSSGRCTLNVIGHSVEGREIFLVDVLPSWSLHEGDVFPSMQDEFMDPKNNLSRATTSQVNFDHPELLKETHASSDANEYPHFLWIGNIHGDETGNREILLRLVALLCGHSSASSSSIIDLPAYVPASVLSNRLRMTTPVNDDVVLSSPNTFDNFPNNSLNSLRRSTSNRNNPWSMEGVRIRLLDLLRTTRVSIVPSLNPDGFAKRQRWNANGVDLNRNCFDDSFPYDPPSEDSVIAYLRRNGGFNESNNGVNDGPISDYTMWPGGGSFEENGLELNEDGKVEVLQTDNSSFLDLERVKKKSKQNHNEGRRLTNEIDEPQNTNLDRNPTPSPAIPMYNSKPYNASEEVSMAAVAWLKAGSFQLQPELIAIQRWLRQNPPDLSANLHGGALVVNFAPDSCDSLGVIRDCRTPDDPLPRLLALLYSLNHPTMSAVDFENGAHGLFRNGTVRGAKWYPVLGSLQDWILYALGRHHLTLELHVTKDPNPWDLPLLWSQNLLSMLRLMEATHMSVTGHVQCLKTDDEKKTSFKNRNLLGNYMKCLERMKKKVNRLDHSSSIPLKKQFLNLPKDSTMVERQSMNSSTLGFQSPSYRRLFDLNRVKSNSFRKLKNNVSQISPNISSLYGTPSAMESAPLFKVSLAWAEPDLLAQDEDLVAMYGGRNGSNYRYKKKCNNEKGHQGIYKQNHLNLTNPFLRYRENSQQSMNRQAITLEGQKKAVATTEPIKQLALSMEIQNSLYELGKMMKDVNQSTSNTSLKQMTEMGRGSSPSCTIHNVNSKTTRIKAICNNELTEKSERGKHFNSKSLSLSFGPRNDSFVAPSVNHYSFSQSERWMYERCHHVHQTCSSSSPPSSSPSSPSSSSPSSSSSSSSSSSFSFSSFSFSSFSFSSSPSSPSSSPMALESFLCETHGAWHSLRRRIVSCDSTFRALLFPGTYYDLTVRCRNKEDPTQDLENNDLSQNPMSCLDFKSREFVAALGIPKGYEDIILGAGIDPQWSVRIDLQISL